MTEDGKAGSTEPMLDVRVYVESCVSDEEPTMVIVEFSPEARVALSSGSADAVARMLMAGASVARKTDDAMKVFYASHPFAPNAPASERGSDSK